ncbi:MAG TPA: hypothetical protein VFZ65_15180 [Planctomycetota bacterium]|nr:hypothetical protein [Planctomycetota bacterium]
MARNRTPQTFEKRARERDKQAKRQAKQAERLARNADKRDAKKEQGERREGVLFEAVERPKDENGLVP